jgi:lipoprotein signal peptidase
MKLVLFAVVVTTIGCDQASKRVASGHLIDGRRQSYLGDSVRLEYSENAGGFLSLGADLPAWARMTLFSFGSAILLIAAVVSVFTRRLGRALWSVFVVRRRCVKSHRSGCTRLGRGFSQCWYRAGQNRDL